MILPTRLPTLPKDSSTNGKDGVAIAREEGWLLMADGGTTLRQRLNTEDDIQHWQNLLPIYAKLQQDATHYLDDFFNLGVPDRRLALLPAKFQQLLTDTDTLGLNHPDGLSSLDYQRLQDQTDLLVKKCNQLATFNIPETLHHGDLHGGNVFVCDPVGNPISDPVSNTVSNTVSDAVGNAVSNQQYLFFDWGDSSIAHPFFSLHSIYDSLNRKFELGENPVWLRRLRESYLGQWAEYETTERLAEAFEFAQKLSPLLAALRWLPVLSSMDSTNRNKYIAAVPDLLREFLSLI